MRKLFVLSLLVLAILGVASWNLARAETITNETYERLVHVKGVCGNCSVDKCHSCKPKCESDCKPKCKPACKPKCEPCKPKCNPCKPKCEPCKPKCEPCKPKCEPCKPKCESKCEPKCGKCCPEVPTTYPDPCRGSADEMTRDGLSRRDA